MFNLNRERVVNNNYYFIDGSGRLVRCLSCRKTRLRRFASIASQCNRLHFVLAFACVKHSPSDVAVQMIKIHSRTFAAVSSHGAIGYEVRLTRCSPAILMRRTFSRRCASIGALHSQPHANAATSSCDRFYVIATIKVVCSLARAVCVRARDSLKCTNERRKQFIEIELAIIHCAGCNERKRNVTDRARAPHNSVDSHSSRCNHVTRCMSATARSRTSM